MAGMVEYLESDFRRWESFDKTPRVASHTPFGVIELMPTSDMETYGFKYVNGDPSNRPSPRSACSPTCTTATPRSSPR